VGLQVADLQVVAEAVAVVLAADLAADLALVDLAEAADGRREWAAR